MDRLPQLTQYYRTVQKNILQQHWSETVEMAVNSGSVKFLREFNEYLLAHWHKQLKWCVTVFGQNTGKTEPTRVLIELLPLLQPSRENAISNCLKRNNDKLGILQEISSANLHFGVTLKNLLLDGNINQSALLRQLNVSIHDWFVVFIAQYAAIEQNYIATLLADLQLVHTTTGESVRSLGNANAKIFEWCEEALLRCEVITENCGLPALVIVLNVSKKK